MKLAAPIVGWIRKPLTMQERGMQATVGTMLGFVVGALISIAMGSPNAKPHWLFLDAVMGAILGGFAGCLAPRWLAAPVRILLGLMTGV
jgi:fructose-specific phosphotransferase system IIC component